MPTIRKPKKAEFRESEVFGAVREARATTSAVSGGLTNFLWTAVLLWIVWFAIFVGFLPLILGLGSGELEDAAEALVPSAIGGAALFVFFNRRKRRSKERRESQLGEVAIGTRALAHPGARAALPSQLNYSRQAVALKAVLLGFVSIISGSLSRGEPGIMVVISAYYCLRTLLLVVNVPKLQQAFAVTPQQVSAKDLLGNKKALRWDAMLAVDRSKAPYWDLITPLLFGTRAFVEVRGVSHDGTSVRVRIPYKLLGILPEDVVAVLEQSLNDEPQSALQKRPSPARQPRNGIPKSDLPEIRAAYATQQRPARPTGFGRKGA